MTTPVGNPIAHLASAHSYNNPNSYQNLNQQQIYYQTEQIPLE